MDMDTLNMYVVILIKENLMELKLHLMIIIQVQLQLQLVY